MIFKIIYRRFYQLTDNISKIQPKYTSHLLNVSISKYPSISQYSQYIVVLGRVGWCWQLTCCDPGMCYPANTLPCRIICDLSSHDPNIITKNIASYNGCFGWRGGNFLGTAHVGAMLATSIPLYSIHNKHWW